MKMKDIDYLRDCKQETYSMKMQDSEYKIRVNGMNPSTKMKKESNNYWQSANNTIPSLSFAFNRLGIIDDSKYLLWLKDNELKPCRSARDSLQRDSSLSVWRTSTVKERVQNHSHQGSMTALQETKTAAQSLNIIKPLVSTQAKKITQKGKAQAQLLGIRECYQYLQPYKYVNSQGQSPREQQENHKKGIKHIQPLKPKILRDKVRPTLKKGIHNKSYNVPSLPFKEKCHDFCLHEDNYQNLGAKLVTQAKNNGISKQNMSPYPYIDISTQFIGTTSQRPLSCLEKPRSQSGNYQQFLLPNIGISKEGLAQFDVGKCKGEGRFGKVYMAKHRPTNFICAIKKIKKQSIVYFMQQFVQEIKLQMYLNHQNIVQTFGVRSDRHHVYIIMEYMEQGSLYEHLKKKKALTLSETKTKLREVGLAVEHIHREGILHRDIKPENIVITNGVCKLTDFGWAVYSKDRRNTYCGTLDYVSPQILSGERYDSSSDIWALGVLIFEMLTGSPPFYNISQTETKNRILHCIFNFPPSIPLPLQSLIRRALHPNPRKRIQITQLISDASIA